VVTTAYHVRRALLLMERYDLWSVHLVGAPAGVNALEVTLQALQEGAALVAALTVQRRC
jgi:hypothetical protein